VRGVVIFGVGSSLVADLEEGLDRAGTPIAAAVANVPGDVHLIDRAPLVARAEVTPEVRALPYLVPLFTPANRRSAVSDAESLGFATPYDFFDPSVTIPRSLATEPGLWVNVGVTLGALSRFGPFVLINRGATVAHHAHLDGFVSIGPGAVLAGEVTVGTGATVGAGAVVLPQVRIGSHATVGAGSVVTDDVRERCVVTGSPARIVRDDLEGF
jgi:serine acetyltransferase